VDHTTNPIYQISGELLSLAQSNFRQGKCGYVFAVEFVGPVVTFYRVLFSREVLESYTNSLVPLDETVIEKYPGKDTSLSLLVPEERCKIIEYLWRLRVALATIYS
jgi:hypothetical protein